MEKVSDQCFTDEPKGKINDIGSPTHHTLNRGVTKDKRDSPLNNVEAAFPFTARKKGRLLPELFTHR